MVRVALATAIAAVLVSPVLGQGPQFEVASIKRNTSADLPIGLPPDPASGEIRLRQVPARNLILQAYPLQTIPVQIVNLPAWAGDRFDVIAKAKPGATAAERQQMFRALLAERMKLAAHYETREQDSYDLVFAKTDKGLGTAIKPTSLDCSSGPVSGPPAPGGIAGARAAALQRCGAFWVEEDTIMSGGVTIENLTRMITTAVGRPIVDRTGLQGYFEITL